MSDEKLRETFERHLPRRRDGAPLDDRAAERLRRVVEQEGNEEDRLRTIEQWLSTAEGRADLDLVWAAARAARPPRRRRRWALVAAVSGIALLPAVWFAERSPESRARGEGDAVDLVGPRGDIPAGAAVRFTWRAAAGTSEYQLVLVDASGTERFAAATNDTALTLPDSVTLPPGMPLRWWVEARDPTGAVTTSAVDSIVVRQ